MENADWSLVESFLAVADTGSLSAAAAALGRSQPTLGRQVQRLEAALGVVLFERHPRGFRLTEAGAALLPEAEAMRSAYHRFGQLAAGRERAPEGRVRITASVVVSHYILPEIIAQLRAEAPGITIDLLPSDASENLLFREADIAVRMYRSTQLDIVTRQIGEMPLGIYATPDYLRRKGIPRSAEDLTAHDLIGYDRDERLIAGLRAVGVRLDRADFAVRCDAQASYWELVAAGCGIGFGPTWAGAREPRVVQLLPDWPIPPLPVWLAATGALRRTPRIRRVWDALEVGLRPYLAPLK